MGHAKGGERRLEAGMRGYVPASGGFVGEPCGVVLRYTADDPLVVSVTVSRDCGRSEHWLISRDLLSAGLSGRTGAGDVTVRPVVDPHAAPGVLLQARDTGRALHIRVSHQALLLYLSRTHALVPFGREVTAARIDHAIEGLLARR
ncbi:SsgA family sporulation/cell division regulator [Streptomyces sp. NPDC006422]|uniref:SsgA family sporulation/cell division regulator n=1 Tax=unclassified Streptomyces TaxID=2593676 RepID=UPI0033AA331F